MKTITNRIDAITGMKEFTSILSAPKSVKIEITGRCNYRCGFCALRTREAQPKEDMDWDLFKRITEEMKEAGVQEIGLFYLGESLMAPDLLIRCLKHVKKLGFYAFLTTNGSLAKPKVVKELMKAGLDSLKFSLNASDKEQFEDLMGVKGKLYDKCYQNIIDARNLRDANGYKTGIFASSIRYDGEQQEKMQENVDQIMPYLDEHYWLPLYSMGSLATQREEELGYRPTAGNQGRLDKLRDPLPCWNAFTEGHVNSFGGLSACGFDATETWIMADLNEVNFMQGWNSAKFVELRRAHLRKDVSGTVCEACAVYG